MKRSTLILIIVAGVALRLVLAAVYHGLYDLVQFERSASIFAHGGNIYVEQFYYNYSPLIGLPLVLVRSLPLPFDFGWRALLSVASLVNGLLIYRISRKPLYFILYWLNPAVMLYDGYAGQFEALAVLPILLALYHKKGTWILGTLAIVIKHSTLFGVWTLFVYKVGARRAAFWLAATVAIFTLTFVPYLPDGLNGIVSRVLLYKSWAGYGFGSSLLFWTVMPFIPFAAKALRLDLFDAMLLSLLSTLVFAYGAGADLFAMIFPLAFLRPSRWLVPLTVAALLLISPLTHLEMATPINTNNLLWIIVTAWAGWMALRGIKIENPLKQPVRVGG